jgi:hypothetical protein
VILAIYLLAALLVFVVACMDDRDPEPVPTSILLAIALLWPLVMVVAIIAFFEGTETEDGI